MRWFAWIGSLCLCSLTWAQDADAIRALRLTDREELSYHWDRGANTLRKQTEVVVVPRHAGGAVVHHGVRYRDEHDDAVRHERLELPEPIWRQLRELAAGVDWQGLEGEGLGRLMETHPRYTLTLEHTAGVTRLSGAGFGDEAAVAALYRALLNLTRRQPPTPAEALAPGRLQLCLTRPTSTVRRGPREDAPSFGMRKRRFVAVDGRSLRAWSEFSDTDGGWARSEPRATTLSAAERTQLDRLLAHADLPALDGVRTRSRLYDYPVYALHLEDAEVSGAGYGRHDDALEPLVDELILLGRRDPLRGGEVDAASPHQGLLQGLAGADR